MSYNLAAAACRANLNRHVRLTDYCGSCGVLIIVNPLERHYCGPVQSSHGGIVIARLTNHKHSIRCDEHTHWSIQGAVSVDSFACPFIHAFIRMCPFIHAFIHSYIQYVGRGTFIHEYAVISNLDPLLPTCRCPRG